MHRNGSNITNYDHIPKPGKQPYLQREEVDIESQEQDTGLEANETNAVLKHYVKNGIKMTRGEGGGFTTNV